MQKCFSLPPLPDRRRECGIGTVTILRDGRQRNRGSILGRGEIFHYTVQTPFRTQWTHKVLSPGGCKTARVVRGRLPPRPHMPSYRLLDTPSPLLIGYIAASFPSQRNCYVGLRNTVNSDLYLDTNVTKLCRLALFKFVSLLSSFRRCFGKKRHRSSRSHGETASTARHPTWFAYNSAYPLTRVYEYTTDCQYLDRITEQLEASLNLPFAVRRQ
jgi:hypothetical protein